MKDRLENLVIAQLDSQAAQSSLGLFEISRALAQAGINPAGVDIFGASSCRVNLNGESVSPPEKTVALAPAPDDGEDTLAERLRQMVARSTALPPASLVIEWRCNNRELLKQPAPENRFQIRPRSTVTVGPVNFEVIDNSPTETGKTSTAERARWTVYGRVYYLCESVTAAQPLAAGHKITAEDVKLAPRRVSSLNDRGVEDIQTVMGKEVVRAVRAHTVILPSMIRRLHLVKRNDYVQVCARVGRVYATLLRGKALDDGAYGDIVSVKDEINKTVIQNGRVTGPREITVGFDEDLVNLRDAATVELDGKTIVRNK